MRMRGSWRTRTTPKAVVIAQVSGEVDRVFRDLSRGEALARAAALAADRAVAAGAERTTLKTVESEDIPIAYLPGNCLRVRVRVVGDVAQPPAPDGGPSQAGRPQPR